MGLYLLCWSAEKTTKKDEQKNHTSNNNAQINSAKKYLKSPFQDTVF